MLSWSFGAVSKRKLYHMSIEISTASPGEPTERCEMMHPTCSPSWAEHLARNMFLVRLSRCE